MNSGAVLDIQGWRERYRPSGPEQASTQTAAGKTLESRVSPEVAVLRREIQALQQQVEELQREIVSLKAAPSSPPSSPEPEIPGALSKLLAALPGEVMSEEEALAVLDEAALRSLGVAPPGEDR